jgi:hypothetical protein
MSVYVAQALCPRRHCIMAAAADTDDPDGLQETLQAGVAHMLSEGQINPWCGLCGARDTSWTYEVGRTRYETLAEATPALREAEAAQVHSAAVMKALGLAVDQPPGAQN